MTRGRALAPLTVTADERDTLAQWLRLGAEILGHLPTTTAASATRESSRCSPV